MITIIVPSYGRADKIRKFHKNVVNNTLHPFEVMYVVEFEQVGDYDKALEGTGAIVVVNARTANYAGAVNTAAEYSKKSKYLFMGADDVNFHKNWDTEALRVMGALPSIKVVGTNDCFNSFVLAGIHATHYLVDNDYVTRVGGVIDGERGHVLFEGYDHNYTDTEFIGTAKARAVFAPCLTSIVEHVGWTTADFQDDTKAKTNQNLNEDSLLYQSRQHLWQNLSR